MIMLNVLTIYYKNMWPKITAFRCELSVLQIEELIVSSLRDPSTVKRTSRLHQGTGILHIPEILSLVEPKVSVYEQER
jgi:hypothetical protein